MSMRATEVQRDAASVKSSLRFDILPAMSHVTQILSAIEQGDPQAADQLLPLIYDELRRLATQRLAHEAPDQTLQATALVHEAYIRLVDVQKPQDWEGRRHFFAAAAEAMRRILVERARRKHSLKRGGGLAREPYHEAMIAAPAIPHDLLALDEALHKLAQTDPKAAELVKLRYFTGLTVKQAAEMIGIGPRTADQLWAYARAWLLDEIQDSSP
jgi:RNA polymerase sigma factor (TIGR02999 family)